MTTACASEIVVGVGDCRVACHPVPSLSTFALGSCLAVVVYDWKMRVGGLLHVMLPDSSIDRQRAVASPFTYVDTGVPELFRRIEQGGGSKRRMRCCTVGGANMMADPAGFEIGRRNYVALKKALWRMGVFIDYEDVGGRESRSVRLNLQTGQIDLRTGCGSARVLGPKPPLLAGRFTSDGRSDR